MNFNFFKAIFSKELLVLFKEDVVYQINDIVQVVKNIPKLDVLPGDTYSIKEVSEDGKSIKITHNLGTRFDVFLSVDNFSLSSPMNNRKFKY